MPKPHGLLARLLDLEGKASCDLTVRLFEAYGDQLYRFAVMAHPWISEAAAEGVVQHAFLDLSEQYRTRPLWRLRLASRRDRAWLCGRVLQRASQIRRRDGGGRLRKSAYETAANHLSGPDRIFAEDMASLPDVQRYCLLSRVSGLTCLEFPAVLQMRRRDFHRHLSAAAGALLDGICEIDGSGLIRSVNLRARRLLGVQEDATVLNLPVHDLLHTTADLDESVCPIHAALESGETHHVAWDRFHTAAGSLEVEYICEPIVHWLNGRVTGAVITFHDAADRRKHIRRRPPSDGTPPDGIPHWLTRLV